MEYVIDLSGCSYQNFEGSPVKIILETKCPGKYVIVDRVTGQPFIGVSNVDDNTDKSIFNPLSEIGTKKLIKILRRGRKIKKKVSKYRRGK